MVHEYIIWTNEKIKHQRYIANSEVVMIDDVMVKINERKKGGGRGERERERDRDRQTDRERETDRQTEIDRDRQVDRETDRQKLVI